MFKYPCTRRVVIAVLIARDGRHSTGSNDCDNMAPKPCPRADKASGEAYGLCWTVCRQQGHAERQALTQAHALGIDTKGSTMHIIGHHHSCAMCEAEMKRCGVARVLFSCDMEAEAARKKP